MYKRQFLENAGIKAGSSALASIGKTIGSGADSVLTAAGSNRIATGIYGASLNTGVGIASRSAISTIFESHGYNELAAQYAPLDTAAMAADAVLGLAFGMLHFQGKDISNDPRIIPSSVIDQSLDDLRAAQEARGTNGLPIDQTAIAIDHAYTEAMFAHITEGIPFETNPDAIKYVQKHSVPDEQTQQLITTGKKTIEETFDPENIGIFEQPHETVLPETQFVLPDEQNANSETKLYPNIEKYLDPIHIENINQIAQSDPYMEIETPDGTYVHAKDYMNHVENDLANTSKDGDLLDAAVACFTRVGL